MLELSSKMDLKNYLDEEIWKGDVLFWTDHHQKGLSPVTGVRKNKPIQGEVHDPRAHLINDFCTHAGLFASIEGISNCLFRMDEKCNLLRRMLERLQVIQEGFVLGWDCVQEPATTLAGRGASTQTFGHLGFTGTSFWISAESKYGVVILSNATKRYWYEKVGIKAFRREIADIVWSNV